MLFAMLMVGGLAGLQTFTRAQDTAPDIDVCGGAAGCVGDLWFVTDFNNRVPENVKLRVAGDRLVVNYSRATKFALIHKVVVAELREVRISLRSRLEATIGLVVQDCDQARFLKLIVIPAGQLVTHRIKVGDFVCSADSPVQREVIDPHKLTYGLVLADVAVMKDGKGDNWLEVERLEIEREPLRVGRGTLVVTTPIEVSESTLRDGDLIVRAGGDVRLTAPRFVLKGRLVIDGGRVRVDGGTVSFPQRFAREFAIHLRRGELSVRDSHVVTRFPLGFRGDMGSNAEFVRSNFDGGLHATMKAGSKLVLQRLSTPGEFFLAAGCECLIQEVRQARVWLNLGANFTKGRLTLPPGAVIADFAPGFGIDARITACADIQWGVVLGPGAEGVIERSELSGIGVLFNANTSVTLRNIHHGRLDERGLPLSDRSVRLVNCKTRSWCVIATDRARVSLERCSFGGAWALDGASIDALDSYCDGALGGLWAQDQAELRLTQCRIGCNVCVSDAALTTVARCDIDGDLMAAERSTLRVVNCFGLGRTVADSQATVVTELQGPVARNTRPFQMALTPFTYDLTAEANAETYKTVHELSDWIMHPLDDGVPWPEALEGKLPPLIVAALKHRAQMSRGKRVAVSLSPQNRAHDGLALRWALGGNMPLPDDWRRRDFGDPAVLQAYLNFCREVIEQLKPVVLIYAAEANAVAKKSPAKWAKFVEFLGAVYAALKKDFPALWLAVSLNVETYFDDERAQRECVGQLLPYTDALALSTFPYLTNADPSSWTAERIEKLAALAPDKPLGISNTGYIAEPLELSRLTLAGTEQGQADYLAALLNACHRLNARFVVWYVPRDFDLLLRRFRQDGDAGFFRPWRDTGLLDGTGKRRLAAEVWRRWLKVPHYYLGG